MQIKTDGNDAPLTVNVNSMNLRIACEEGDEYKPFQNREILQERLFQTLEYLSVR